MHVNNDTRVRSATVTTNAYHCRDLGMTSVIYWWAVTVVSRRLGNESLYEWGPHYGYGGFFVLHICSDFQLFFAFFVYNKAISYWRMACFWIGIRNI